MFLMSEAPLYRCRANLEQINQSRPDSGLGLSHFLFKSLEHHLSCSVSLALYPPLSLTHTHSHIHTLSLSQARITTRKSHSASWSTSGHVSHHVIVAAIVRRSVLNARFPFACRQEARLRQVVRRAGRRVARTLGAHAHG